MGGGGQGLYSAQGICEIKSFSLLESDSLIPKNPHQLNTVQVFRSHTLDKTLI